MLLVLPAIDEGGDGAFGVWGDVPGPMHDATALEGQCCGHSTTTKFLEFVCCFCYLPLSFLRKIFA